MRKSDEDWVKKCMELKADGRPRWTWLDSVKVGMAENPKKMFMTKRNGGLL